MGVKAGVGIADRLRREKKAADKKKTSVSGGDVEIVGPSRAQSSKENTRAVPRKIKNDAQASSESESDGEEVAVLRPQGIKRYKCKATNCGKVFKNKTHLRRHTNDHRRHTFFKCRQCDR